MEGTNHKCIRKLLMRPNRAEATQVEFTNFYILEIIPRLPSETSLPCGLVLTVVVKHKKEKKKPKSTLLNLTYFSVKITSISQN